jgi:hypothetical protein
MSNPGVIVLASLKNIGPNIKRFDIEDNIGESIHIHWNGLRLDMTIEDFLELSNVLMKTLESFYSFADHDLLHLDSFFLFKMGKLSLQIKEINIEERRLCDLVCLVRKKTRFGNIIMAKKIKNSPAYRYLDNTSNDFIDYAQDAYPGQNNESRLIELRDSIRKNGYPSNKEYIVVFGDQGYIRDGQHRACILAKDLGLDHTVKVMVINFRGNTWKINIYKNAIISILNTFKFKLKFKMTKVRQRYF